MDSSGFNSGRAVAVPLVPRQGVVFGKAAAAGKSGAGTAVAKAVVGTAGGKAVAGSLPGSGSGPSRQTFKGARPGAQVYNADTEQDVNNRKPSPTRTRKPAPAVAHPPVKQNPGGAIFSDVEHQREANAKAQRLLRFSQGQEISDLVSQPTSGRVSGKAEHRFSQREARQPNQSPKPLVDNAQHDTMETEALGEDFSDTEAIVGTCDDMCSEAERHERERKGDLDKFERVDGDRNVTSVDLAVKKYTRTPSREPHLIRPLPVLKVTMNYLLSLINQDYNEGLLRLHSFLWDRMRAVRMDLRMQHIFNREAITMHEQMIRFHILAMHELCEYKKGEGFNEGFDAHLNIEQMNKASVDLFEMYDDHRKKGIQFETEAEFRGYYALLKLDKHPGYSVEPAELSLDLAKMTPEMRNTPQVLFARDVARACRGGNYIAFFRLARKSTYLQACLMHAHFAKLRTEALAILHSGLQKNQGVPITQVVKWLGMEGEDIETLVEYHGFSLKAFEKLYAIKDGPFLNRDAEYQARRSRLVEAKRSSTIVEDVEGKGQQQAVVDSWAATPMTPGMQEEEMPDYEEDDPPFPAETSQASPVLEHWTTAPGRSSPGTGQGVDDMRISPPYKSISPPREGQITLPATFSSKTLPLWPTPHQNHLVPKSLTENLSPQRSRKRESYPGRLTQDIDLKEGNKKLVTVGGAIDVEPEEEEDDDVLEPGPTLEEIRAQRVLEWEVEKENEREKERERERRKRATEEAEAAAAKWAAKLAADAELKRQRQEEQRLAAYRAEASAGKKRLWLRRWKRRAAIMAEEKLRRKIRAEAALGSLSVGPPLAGPKSDKDGALITLANGGSARMTIDQVARMRSEKIREMWKPLDVASLVLPLFEHKFPSTRFVTFKLLLSLGDRDASNMAGQWLSNKLSRSQLVIPEVHADGRTPGLWFKAMNIESKTSYQEAALHGASGLVFLVRKGHSVFEERARLHSLVETLPVGVRLPLLLLYSPTERNIEAETEKLKASLGLYDFEGLRIGWQNVSPVSSSNDGGLYSDGFLCGGLVWLANSSPSQPNLRPIHIRELVTSNLDGHCKILMASSSSNVTPERCISIFNRSLRSAAMEIRKAVSAAPPHWPPEEAESEVSGVLPGILPQQGWNEPDLLDPIHQALHLAELPRFPTIEQVKPGSPTSAWENVQYQKAAVERVMQQYLARIDGINEDDPVLVRQAQVMVRRNSCLEWTESGRVLVPRWANIFQAIYQTRLLLLNSEPPPIVYVVSKDAEEVERPLELDEVEQQIPFASEIAAGTPFGRTRHVNLIFDDTEEQETRTTLQEKLSLAKSYTDRFSGEDYESRTPLKQQLASPEKMDEDTSQFLIQGNTWSIFSPSLESWQRGQPVSLKKRRLSLSPESITQTLPRNLSNSLASIISTESSSVSDLQAPGSPGFPLLDTRKDHEIIGTFGIPRLPEEILLDNIVMKLNYDVDRVLRRASSDMCFADTQFPADLNSEGAINERSCFRSDSNVPYDRTVDSGVSKHIEPRQTTNSSDIGTIDDMLERCRRTQKSIDRKLEDTFGIVYDSLHSNT